MNAEERAVEINRLLLAQLKAGSGFLALPVPAMAPAPARRQRKTGAKLLAKKEAARRLGVDRATTLERLIASGYIKTVPFNGRVRIPLAEVERVLNEGIPSGDTFRLKAHRPARAVTSSQSESPGAAIRNLKL
jgi:excisionase family DNA binding protein